MSKLLQAGTCSDLITAQKLNAILFKTDPTSLKFLISLFVQSTPRNQKKKNIFFLFTAAIVVVIETYAERNVLKYVTIKYGKEAVEWYSSLVKGL